MSKKAPKAQPQGDVAVEERTESERKLDKPRRFKVLIHNDDFTPREFVVLVLIQIFRKSESDAQAIMLEAEKKGRAVVGAYTREVAETKVAEVMALADQAQVPFLCTAEPE